MFRLPLFFFFFWFMKPPRLKSAPCAEARKGGRSAGSAPSSGRAGFYFPIIKKHLLGADELRRGWARAGSAPVMLRACRRLFMHQMWPQIFPWRLGRAGEEEGRREGSPCPPRAPLSPPLPPPSLKTSATQNVVPGPTTLARSLLTMQISRPTRTY